MLLLLTVERVTAHMRHHINLTMQEKEWIFMHKGDMCFLFTQLPEDREVCSRGENTSILHISEPLMQKCIQIKVDLFVVTVL